MVYLKARIIERCFQFFICWVMVGLLLAIPLHIILVHQVEWGIKFLHYIFGGFLFVSIGVLFSPLLGFIGFSEAQKGTKSTNGSSDKLCSKCGRNALSATGNLIRRYYHLEKGGYDNEKPENDKHTTSYKPSFFHLIEPFVKLIKAILLFGRYAVNHKGTIPASSLIRGFSEPVCPVIARPFR